jgi:hypothetical protein
MSDVIFGWPQVQKFHKKIFEMAPWLSFYRTKAEQQNSESLESLGKRLRADLGVDIKNGIWGGLGLFSLA